MASSRDESVMIREVWNYNLENEFRLIREIVDDYPYIGMDTEFPGTVLRFIGRGLTDLERAYREVKCNVDILKLIQLGLTFADGEGNLPRCRTGRFCVWQFNFCEFDPTEDICATDSIDLLRSSGINFDRHKRIGVDSRRFGDLLISSGAVLNSAVQWVTFHSCYDFCYVLRLVSGKNLPDTYEKFQSLLGVFFPVINDLKYMTSGNSGLQGGLGRLADILNVKRVGVSHQAGSDSLVTFRAFLNLNGGYLDGSVRKDAGVVYGFGDDKSNNVPKETNM